MWSWTAIIATSGIVSVPHSSFADTRPCSLLTRAGGARAGGRVPAVRAVHFDNVQIDSVIWPLLHHVEGIIGVSAVAAVGLNLSRGHRESSTREQTDIKEVIRATRETSALTYGDAHAAGPHAADPLSETDASEEKAREAQRRERRRLALDRAQNMLDAARDDVQGLLEEAVRMDDPQTAQECARLLEKMRPLPEGIALTSRDQPDYKRWLDPDALR